MGHGIYNDHSWPRPPRTCSCQQSLWLRRAPQHGAGASHRCGVRQGPPIAIVESPRPGPSWNTASSVGHLTSAGMDKFWRRSREELLIDMEGLSYVDRLKSLSPFSLERRRRRLRGIFAVCEHLKGDHKDSGQDLIRLSSNRKQPPETPGSVPPPRGLGGFSLTALLGICGARGSCRTAWKPPPTRGMPSPHSRLRACASNCDRFCRVASLTSTLSPLRIFPGRSSRSLWTEFSEATTTSAYLRESLAVSQQKPAPSGSPPGRG